MTREAKIGLLTGLIVIVLIGVLLSEYLGGPVAGVASDANRMAALPIGAGYREQVMKPITVPGMGRSEPAAADAGSPAQFPAPASAVSTGGQGAGDQGGNLPTAFAARADTAEPAVRGSLDPAAVPVVDRAVTPIRDGRVAAAPAVDAAAEAPIIQVIDRGTPAAAAPVAGAVKATAATEQYVIASGDTLSKIAKKFYHSAKPEDVQRIVEANPGLLKAASTMLVVGKKLAIPEPVAAVAGKTALRADAGESVSRAAVVIGAPGSKPEMVAADQMPGDGRSANAGRPEAPKAGGHVYVVQGGDTLEKIAHRLSPHGAAEYAKKVAALNKIKDARGLQIGEKLVLP